MRFVPVMFLILLIFTALVPVGAQSSDDADNSIRIAMPNPTYLDPVALSRFDVHGRDLVENLFIGLTRLNARTGQIEPALAESWTVSADGLTWTFALRDDVQWVRSADGEAEAIRPVTAGDVVFAIQRACDPRLPSPVATNIYIIAGCRAFADNNTLEQIDPARTIAVRAVDDNTLEITLVFPAAYFLTMTSLPEFRPLPADLMDQSLGQGWFSPANAITSGAWVIAEWTPGINMRLLRNPFWEGEFSGNLSEIDVRFDVPIDAIASQIADGTVDAARLEPITVDQVDPELRRAAPGNTLILLGFSFSNVNVEGVPVPSPLDSPEVRRALALAIDREVLAQAVFGSEAAGTDHFTPLSVIGAPSSPGASFDPAAAQQTLAAAGYAGCAGLRDLSLAVSDNPQEIALAQNVIGQWVANLGCPVEAFPLVQATRTQILDTAHNLVDVSQAARFPLWIITWTADYPDAQGWVVDALHCTFGYFRVGRTCDQVDIIMDQAGVSSDIRARFTAYNQVETTLFGSQGTFPVLPLIMQQQWWAQQSDLENIASYGAFQFDRWTVEN